MKNIFFILFFSISLNVQAQSEEFTGFGIGGMIGDPTAVSFKGHFGNSKYFDVALGNNSGSADGIYIHGTYIIEREEYFEVAEEPLNLYFGVGARFYEAEDDGDDELYIGPRVPVGVSYYLKDPTIEFFGEVSVIMNLSPETESDLDVSIGARYWF